MKAPPVRITLPDGAIVNSQQLGLHQVLSNVLKREVTLDATVYLPQEIGESTLPDLRTATAEEYWADIEGLEHRDTVTDFGLPEGTFFDCAVVHLLTTATLDRLRELYPPGRFEVRWFRPNIVVETANGEKDFVEDAWIGQILAIGDAVRLSITGPCGRCVMTTLPQGDLPRDTGILRTAAQHNRANVGVYASVLQGGKIRRGDSVRLEQAMPVACLRQQPDMTTQSLFHHKGQPVSYTLSARRFRMPKTEQPSLYDRLGGVYSIATVVDDFINRIMIDPKTKLQRQGERGASSRAACGIQVPCDRDGLLGDRRPAEVYR